jgi:hypothetical protein
MERPFSVVSVQRGYLEDNRRYDEKKNKILDTEQIYGHGSQRGSMPRVTVLAGCRQ